MSKTIRIGGASGFWGDSMMAAPQLLAGGKLDYLVFDYLAEITMSIMARARAQNPTDGYATDFVSATMRQCLPEIARQNVKVISNAGGVNPQACAAALEALIAQLGLSLKVATVTGDDVMPLIPDLRERGMKEMFSGDAMPAEFMSANAYLGAFPIARALDKGADIVVTGRGVDSAVTLGACIHAFGWKETDYDVLAGGSLAGHIIECGAQATGGLFTDWQSVEGWENIGYPIAEVSADGSFTIGKPENTGGIVLPATVAEQMVYEIGDPQAYILPDVVCDFSQVRIEQVGDNLVRVMGAGGAPPTDTYKVSATYQDGFRVGLYLTIAGIDADGKARKTADAILKRCRVMLRMRNMADFKETNVELIGAESGYGANRRGRALREVILKLAAKHDDPKALAMLLREATSSGTSMSPGTTGMGGNRPKPSPIVRLFSFLLPKSAITPQVHMNGETWDVEIASGTPFDAGKLARPGGPLPEAIPASTKEVPLVSLAWGRSGDKGNNANIGILAREQDYLPYIRAALTQDAVAQYFAHFLEGRVERFDLPGVNGVNFMLHDVLGGGGMASLRNDPQGKTYAQMLLDFPVPVPADIARRVSA
ncbi:MAG TPA: acyclic terpene utilization AtuA family protein [Rhizomicrobium sp.]|jgi:hypothetical protein|nr:acyclic terpene utilization AtuA family protein [Rhizomicrobium sp.]